MKRILCSAFLLCTSLLIADSDPVLSITPSIIELPIVTTEELHQGFVQKFPRRIQHALKIHVQSGSPKKPWSLYVKAKNPKFFPAHAGKSASDLLWKHNHERGHAFRELNTHKQLVFQSVNGDSKRLKIDFSALLSWADQPESYSLPLSFILVED